MKYDLLFWGVCLSVLGLGNRNREGQDCDESRPTLRGGQASDQATSGGQAGTGSNRRTDQAKSTHAKRRASAYEGHVHRHQGQPEHQTRRSPKWGNVDYNAVAERTFTTQRLLCTHSQCIWSATAPLSAASIAKLGRLGP